MSASRGTALPLLVLLLAQGATSLHIVFGAHNIPHPAKASTGGEDAFFFDDRLGIFGIADGVGGSAKNGQVDPGAFSREVLSRTYQCVNVAPRLPDALQMASAAPIDLGGSTTLVLGQPVSRLMAWFQLRTTPSASPWSSSKIDSASW